MAELQAAPSRLFTGKASQKLATEFLVPSKEFLLRMPSTSSISTVTVKLIEMRSKTLLRRKTLEKFFSSQEPPLLPRRRAPTMLVSSCSLM